jgi:hypothetical protein
LRAHALYPNARTFRALGMVEYELRNYPGSIVYLERALEDKVRALDATARADAERLIAQARVYVARYTLVLQPGDAAVSVDGAPAQLDERHVLLLQVGDHVLDVRAPGHLPVHRELHVEGQIDRTIELRLTPVVATKSEAPAADKQDKSKRMRRWLWASVGVVAAAGLTTGLVLGLRDDAEKPQSGTTGLLISLPSSGR